MRIVLYSNGCSNCNQAKRALDENEVQYATVSDMDDIMEEAGKSNIKSMPFMKINDDVLMFNEFMKMLSNGELNG